MKYLILIITLFIIALCIWNLQLFLGNGDNDKYALYAKKAFNITVNNVRLPVYQVHFPVS